jgi:hypothetical protein
MIIMALERILISVLNFCLLLMFNVFLNLLIYNIYTSDLE